MKRLSTSCLRWAALCLALLFLTVPAGAAWAAETDRSLGERTGSTISRQGALSDTSDHPNTVPYETSRSLGYHVLALPAYVLDAATWPLGWTVRYLEQNYPSLFIPKPQTRGVRPLIELGGPNGVELGVALFSHDFLGTGHDVRATGQIAAQNSWQTGLRYTIPVAIGRGASLQFFGEYEVENRRRFFLGGNDADRVTDEAEFESRKVDARTTLRYGFTDRLRGLTELQYEHLDTAPSSTNPDLGERIAGEPGIGQSDLVTVKTGLTVDFTERTVDQGIHRRSRGTVLVGRVGYTHGLNDDRFRFARFLGEVQQYVPLPMFPDSRRLALRARIEKVESLFDGERIPFYDLPGLGGQESLRGFTFDRFVNDGILLLNAEYRYPIWSYLDGLVFVDAGQAFNGFGDLAHDRFRWSYGGGVHLLSQRKLGARLEMAHSSEGFALVLTVTPTFGPRLDGE